MKRTKSGATLNAAMVWLVLSLVGGPLACLAESQPTWVLSDPAAVDKADNLGLGTALAELAAERRMTLSDPATPGVALHVGYDGRRLVGELRGVTPTEECPWSVYLAQGDGARAQYRFAGPKDVQSYVNGDVFGGTAPRAVSGDAQRFYLPILGGEVALHVRSCIQQAPFPTVILQLLDGGGLRWAPATTPTIVGVGVPGDNDHIGLDKARFLGGDVVGLVGHDLPGIDAIAVGNHRVTAIRVVSPDQTVFALPPESGDVDAIIPYMAGKALGPVNLVVEGPIHRLEDTMSTFSGAVWGEWLVILLVAAGLILTIVNGFPQFRGFGHALAVVRGRYDNPNEQGEISHFQALTTALSATVGLGNIAGVAVAITKGGPGALFWMWVCGFLGMATKYSECTLATAYRDVRKDGTVAGGPMYYMAKQLHPYLKPMAFVFAALITLASFGGGNMFQANQAAALWQVNFGVPTWVTGLVLVSLVGLVIIGGIKRIARVTDKLVPAMCAAYVAGALVVIGMHISEVPAVFAMIFREAFSVSAAVGGALGIVIIQVLKQGFQRAAFSNEAGFGSAAIAHAAVKTDEPVREGVVALLEPFIDTVVICTMTGLVIIFSGLWTQQGLDGAPLTAAAFNSAFDGFGSYLIPIAVFLFAASTMISWSYYGEKGVEFVMGPRSVLPYRLFFVGLIFVGAVWKLGPVLDFSDAMLGLVAVPNLIAVLLLAPKLRALTRDYFGRLKSGAMQRYK